MVNIVTIAGVKYLVDVGFGSFGPVEPIELRYRVTEDTPQRRVVHMANEHIPDNTHRDNPQQLLWIYKTKPTKNLGARWIPGYCFSEVEFLPSDFEMMSFYLCYSPTSWFRWHVVASVFLWEVEYNVYGTEHDDIEGTMTIMGDEVKERRRGVSKVVKKLDNENERVQALRDYLGIELTDVQKRSILGTVSQLR